MVVPSFSPTGFSTADIFDADPNGISVCSHQFRILGLSRNFAGPCRTLRISAHPQPVRRALEEKLQGGVLVVDVNGDVSAAVFGDQLAKLAVANGWAGIVVNGAVRDAATLDTMPIGIRALALTARRQFSEPTIAIFDEDVAFGGASFRPGSWLFADEDAVVVASSPRT